MRKRHTETQVYVGAFQYLTWKQFHHPKKGADRTNKLNALKNLSWLSKNLLCEIETAINNTRMRMPKILSREEMNERLTFHNNGNKMSFDTTKVDEVDEIDYKYAKVRFSEYLHALQQMLQNRRGKHHANKNIAQRKMQAANVLSTSVNKAVHATDVTTLNRSGENHSRKNLRKALRTNPNTNAQYNLHHNQFDSNISATKHSEHHRPLHRKRVGQGKKRRMQKQSRNGVVGTKAMQLFRRNQRKSTVSPIRVPRVSTTTTATTTTTTVAPQT